MKPEHYIEQAFGDRTKEESSVILNTLIAYLVLNFKSTNQHIFNKKKDLYKEGSVEFEEQFKIAARVGKELKSETVKRWFMSVKGKSVFWTCRYELLIGDKIEVYFNLSYKRGRYTIFGASLRKYVYERGSKRGNWDILVMPNHRHMKMFKKGSLKPQLSKYLTDYFKKYNKGSNKLDENFINRKLNS